MDAPHALAAEAVCAALGVDPESGLSRPEAAERLARRGPNALPDIPPPG